MHLGERIKALWNAVGARSAAGARLRRRIAATAGMALFTGTFLVAIGFAAIVLSVLAAVLVVIVTIAFVATWPHLQNGLSEGLRRLRRRGVQARRYAGPRIRRVYRSSFRIGATAGRRSAALTKRSVTALPPLWQQTRLVAEPRVRGVYRSSVRMGATAMRTAHSTAIGIASHAGQTDPRRRALRLNAAGTQYRRDGHYDHAVECHRRALEIFRALDDRKAVALTQSNLALALSHAGDDNWSIGLFEEAAATLRELGDEEHEAQIIANLGLAHRRHGRREEGDNVLELALSKLAPASSEYQAIEAELRRAS